MPTDGENVLFDDRAGRNDGVLSQDEIDRLIASIDTEHSYCMDPESEYKKHDHLLWMMADDDERFREYDPLYEDYINDYLYSHGAFNRIREIYTEWDVSEGSFKYLEGMESGYRKKFYSDSENFSDNDILGSELEVYSRIFPDHKIMELGIEFKVDYLKMDDTTCFYTFERQYRELSEEMKALVREIRDPSNYDKVDKIKNLCDKVRKLCDEGKIHVVFRADAEKNEEMYSEWRKADAENQIQNFSEIVSKADYLAWHEDELKKITEMERILKDKLEKKK